MEIDLREILKDNSINLNKITIKNNVKIIDTNRGNYVIKKEDTDLDNTYNYLLSRSFDYFPKPIIKKDDYNIYEYINDVEEPVEQRILDIITLLTMLHSKTTFYKEIDIDNYKYLYETIDSKLEYLFNYYNDIISNYKLL